MGKGGGGSTPVSAGGGSSSTDYPSYMKTKHEAWLNSVDLAMSAAMAGNSPFFGFTPTEDVQTVFGSVHYVPNTHSPFALFADLVSFDPAATFLAQYTTSIGRIDMANWFDDYVDQLYVCQAIAAEAACIRKAVNREVLPSFLAGMRDINAVQSTSFTIGRANIEEALLEKLIESDRKMRFAVAMQDADLNAKWAAMKVNAVQNSESVAGTQTQVLQEFHRLLTAMSSELIRVYYTASIGEDKMMVEIAAKDKLWDLDVFQYGTQVMACISGAAIGKDASQISPTGSVLGSGMSGAAMGATIGWAVKGSAAGGLYGAAIGAGVGLLSSLFGM